jgi:hypothetical protein
MKKLYFLDEEEKNRILNIHEGATKRQYLNEDKYSDYWKTLDPATSDKFATINGAVNRPGTDVDEFVKAVESLTKAEFDKLEELLNYIGMGGYKSFKSMVNGELEADNVDVVKKIVDALKKLNVTATFESPQGDPFSWKENTFNITSQPVNTSTKTFTDAATACIKQFSSDVKTSSTPGFVYTPLTDGSNLFFGVNYSIQYKTKGKSTIYGNWSCKGNVLNITRKDGLTWSKAQGGWKKPTDKTVVVDPKKAYQERAKQVNQQTIDATKQIQQSLGVETPSGVLDSAEVETIINKLKQ